MTYFLDTNIFVRVVARDNIQMANECEKLFEMIRNGKIKAVTSIVVITELGWLLKSFYKFSKPKIASLLISIVKINGLTITQDIDIISALEYYQNVNVSLIDAIIAAMPKIVSKEWTVISYDEDFKKLPVKWLLPGNVI